MTREGTSSLSLCLPGSPLGPLEQTTDQLEKKRLRFVTRVTSCPPGRLPGKEPLDGGWLGIQARQPRSRTGTRLCRGPGMAGDRVHCIQPLRAGPRGVTGCHWLWGGWDLGKRCVHGALSGDASHRPGRPWCGSLAAPAETHGH